MGHAVTSSGGYSAFVRGRGTDQARRVVTGAERPESVRSAGHGHGAPRVELYPVLILGVWMDLDLEQLTTAVLRLPDAARAELATRLLESLDPDVLHDAAAVAITWEAELDRREAELLANPESGIPVEEVLRVLTADLAATRDAQRERGH